MNWKFVCAKYANVVSVKVVINDAIHGELSFTVEQFLEFKREVSGWATFERLTAEQDGKPMGDDDILNLIHLESIPSQPKDTVVSTDKARLDEIVRSYLADNLCHPRAAEPYIKIIRALVSLARDGLRWRAANASKPRRWRHIKRGTTYTEIGPAALQTAVPLGDYADVTVYRSDKDGALWVRSSSEFIDGRFEEVEPGSGPSANASKDDERDAKFTRGPWRYIHSDPAEGCDVWWITGGVGNNCEKEIATVPGGCDPSAEGNARLIAAAPELRAENISLTSHVAMLQDAIATAQTAMISASDALVHDWPSARKHINGALHILMSVTTDPKGTQP